MRCFYSIPLICIFMTVSRTKSRFLCSTLLSRTSKTLTFSLHFAGEERKIIWKQTKGMKKMMDDGKPHISGEDLQTCWHKVHRCKQIQTRSNKKPLCSFPDQFLPSAFVLCLFPSMNQSESDQWRQLMDMFAYTAIIRLMTWQQFLLQSRPEVWKLPDKHTQNQIKSTTTRSSSFWHVLYLDRGRFNTLTCNLIIYMLNEIQDLFFFTNYGCWF